MSTKEVTTWQDETALDRFQLISPLLDDRMDISQLVQKRKEIAEACGKSDTNMQLKQDIPCGIFSAMLRCRP